MMTVASVASLMARIARVEEELRGIKAEAEKLKDGRKPRTFGDLYGIFAGRMSATDEEIEEAKYGFKWEGERMR